MCVQKLVCTLHSHDLLTIHDVAYRTGHILPLVFSAAVVSCLQSFPSFCLKILLEPLEKYATFLNYKNASPPQTTGGEGRQTDEHMPPSTFTGQCL
jgi:hypothetical protein